MCYLRKVILFSALKFEEYSPDLDTYHFDACCHELGGESFFAYSDIGMSSVRFVPILYTNRSGSNFLSELIASSSDYNIAAEVFNSEEIIRVCREYGIKYFHEYVSAIVANNAINDYFFVKLGTPHLFLLEKAGFLSLFFNRQKALWSRRANVNGQAVSFFIAQKTGAWASYQVVNTPALSSEDYDFSGIHYFYSLIKNQESCIGSFVSSNAISCFEVGYEQLCLDMIGTISGVASFLGNDKLTVNTLSIATSKQANEINLCFEQRFADDLKGLPS